MSDRLVVLDAQRGVCALLVALLHAKGVSHIYDSAFIQGSWLFVDFFFVLSGFAVAGQLIFRMFGITLPAFEVAGGLILLLIGLDMLEARRSPTQETLGEAEEAAAKEDAGVVPLGVPMLAGPGAISSVMVMVGQAPSLWHWEMAAILGSILITAVVSYWVLAAAGRIRVVMGESGIRILVRIMGLLLVALAMQLFINGLTDLGILARH